MVKQISDKKDVEQDRFISCRFQLFHRFTKKKNEPMQLIFTFYLYFCHAILSFAILFVQH